MALKKLETFMHPFPSRRFWIRQQKRWPCSLKTFVPPHVTTFRLWLIQWNYATPPLSPQRVNLKNEKSWILALQPSTFCQEYGDATHETPKFEEYLATPVNKNVDALAWWKENEARFPKSAQIARQYLCIPATSAASERQFSAANEILIARCRKKYWYYFLISCCLWHLVIEL